VKRCFSRRWKYGYLFALLLTVLAAGCGGGDWSSGDRVLVAKFLYDTGLKQPRRYDVVVFRFPERPIENGTPKNYIKRLLGLPGELLALFFGNIYRYNSEKHGPIEHTLANVESQHLWRCKKNAATSRDFEGVAQFGMLENLKSDQVLFEKGKFEILRKSPATLLAMRRIVYDNDHQPKDLASDTKFTRWMPEDDSSWKVIEKTGLACSGAVPKDEWIRYRHIPRNSPGAKMQLITDFLGYNAIATTRMPRPGEDMPQVASPRPYDPAEHNWVGDLILDCDLNVKEAKGEFCMELSKGPDRFQARWALSTGECTLYRLPTGGEPTKLASKKTRVSAPGTYEVRFANVDDRLTVWVGRDLPFDDGVTYRRPREEHGPHKNDLQPASLGSKGAAVEVRHLRLWRDVYYTLEASQPAVDSGAHLPGVDYSDPKTWEPLRKLNFKTIYVQKGHYFCMGDNSTASSDSRDWGLVPERLMLGRALLVYFPFSRAGVIE
jgi:signal peptidase I